MKKIFLILIFSIFLMIPVGVSADEMVKYPESLFGYSVNGVTYTSATATAYRYKLDVFFTPLEGEHKYNLVLGFNRICNTGYNNSRVFLLADDTDVLPFKYVLYYNDEPVEEGESSLTSGGNPVVLLSQNFTCVDKANPTRVGRGVRAFAYYNASGLNWVDNSYISVFKSFVSSNSLYAGTSWYGNTFQATGNTTGNDVTISGVPSQPRLEYDPAIGYVTDVRFNTSRIAGAIASQSRTVLDVVCGRYSSTGVDFAAGRYSIEYRVLEETASQKFNSLVDMFTKLPAEAFNYTFNLLANKKYNLYITPTIIRDGVKYFGDSYIIPRISNTAIGSVVLDDYMRDVSSSTTTGLNSVITYVQKTDITNILNEGDQIENNYTTENTENYIEYNYTTFYDNDEIYNDYRETNTYNNDKTINFGPFGSDNSDGFDWFEGIDWGKLMKGLFSFLTKILGLLVPLVSIFSFLPEWVTFFISSILVIGFALIVVKALINIFKHIVGGLLL